MDISFCNRIMFHWTMELGNGNPYHLKPFDDPLILNVPMVKGETLPPRKAILAC